MMKVYEIRLSKHNSSSL